jgi:hypothetical protein
LGKVWPTNSKTGIFKRFLSHKEEIMAKQTATKARGSTTKNKDMAGKQEHAYFLFMKRTPQKDIASRLHVTEKTITNWKTAGNWEAKRAAKTISMDELINKALMRINELLDSDDFSADSFAKAVSQLKSLQSENTVDNDILTFMDFQDYLIRERINESLPEDFIKTVVRMQDNYVQIRLAGGRP